MRQTEQVSEEHEDEHNVYWRNNYRYMGLSEGGYHTQVRRCMLGTWTREMGVAARSLARAQQNSPGEGQPREDSVLHTSAPPEDIVMNAAMPRLERSPRRF